MGPSFPQKGGHNPQFSAHVYCCGQTAGCIRIPLGTEVGLGSGDFVLDGDPAPPKVEEPPNFWPMSIRCGQMAGWIKMPFGMAVDLGPVHIVLGGDPASPSFRPMSFYCCHGRPSQLLLSSCLHPCYSHSNFVKWHFILIIFWTAGNNEFGTKWQQNCLFMVALCSRADHYIFALWFLSSFFFSSHNLSGQRLDVYHTSTHGVALVRI